MTVHTLRPTDSTSSDYPVAGTSTRPCEFELVVFSKNDNAAVDASGPTLAVAISHSLPGLRQLAHSRAVFGARPFGPGRRTYGAWEIIFPDDGERPEEGYAQFGVRRVVGFDDSIEVFDVYQELREYEGLLRYRAQDLGDDEKSIMLIADGVRNFVQAARYATLWDPECKLDIPASLDELFLDRDWSRYVDSEEFTVPASTVEDVRVIARTDENEYLVRFRYENGENSGFDMEFVDIREGKATIRNNTFSALRSPVPAFRGDQLPTVYDKLQAAADVLDFACLQKMSDIA